MTFAVWTVVKMIGLYLYNKQAVFDYIGAEITSSSTAEKNLVTNIAIVIVAFIMLIAVAIQMYTGASAIVVGRGRSKKKRRMYLVFGAIMLVLSALSVIELVKTFFVGQNDDTPDIFKGSIIVEFTQLVLIAEMIYSSIKIKILLSRGKHSKTE